MEEYYLVDIEHNALYKKQWAMYKVAAEIAVRHGPMGPYFHTIADYFIRQDWPEQKKKNFPTTDAFRKLIKINHLKWYIRHELDVDFGKWNSDFIHGLATYGSIKWYKKRFPTLFWWWNPWLYEILKLSPFGGKLTKVYLNQYRWISVPAFYMQYSEKSCSFMAGVLASGKIFDSNDGWLIRYRGDAKEYIRQWNIPIEKESSKGNYIFISGFWLLLFTVHMPKEVAKIFKGIGKPPKSDLFAPILWRTYINDLFPSGGIPYLKSRRQLFYSMAKTNNEGLTKHLDMLRLKTGLVALDVRVRDTVYVWGKKYQKPSKTKEVKKEKTV